jgi:ribonuclease P protein component
VLPASARVRSRSQHRLVAARGRRARRGPLVVHLYVDPSSATAPPRAGVIVGKRVGSAVTRNLVKRRLREQLRAKLSMLPTGSLAVVRALPGAGEAGFSRLGGAMEQAITALVAASDRSAAAPATAGVRP